MPAIFLCSDIHSYQWNSHREPFRGLVSCSLSWGSNHQPPDEWMTRFVPVYWTFTRGNTRYLHDKCLACSAKNKSWNPLGQLWQAGRPVIRRSVVQSLQVTLFLSGQDDQKSIIKMYSIYTVSFTCHQSVLYLEDCTNLQLFQRKLDSD